jgi:di/tricarboxylate transporter
MDPAPVCQGLPRFAPGDCWRVGLSLALLIIAVSIPLILWRWPF